MLTSMTLAEIQAKYSEIHTPEEIEQFHQNMDNSKKWKVVKNEWTCTIWKRGQIHFRAKNQDAVSGQGSPQPMRTRCKSIACERNLTSKKLVAVSYSRIFTEYNPF